jgi:site-specific recombinase XerD
MISPVVDDGQEWMEELGVEAHLPPDWWRAQLPLIAPRHLVVEMLACEELDANARLALRCQYRTGMRAEEVFEATVRDGRLWLGQRVVAVDRETLELLRATPVVGERRDLESWLGTAARAVGLAQRYEASGRAMTEATLRHAFASHALEDGMDPITLYYQLGHRFISTTQMYLGTAMNFYRSQYESFHPLCGMTRGGKEQAKISIREALDLLDAPTTVRVRLILRTLYATALRSEEIRTLLCADVNVPEARIFVRDAKGPADMVALVDRETADQLGAYIAGRPPHEPVFPNIKSAMTLWDMVRKAAQKTGIWEKYKGADKSVSPHTFRHAYATHCYQSGMDPAVLSRLMGHWDPQNLLTYAQCNREYLQRSHSQHHPLCRDVRDCPLPRDEGE